MGVEINIEHPEGKQSGAYCATELGPAAHGLCLKAVTTLLTIVCREKSQRQVINEDAQFGAGMTTGRPQHPELTDMLQMRIQRPL
jgi:hypothetical protein